MNTQMKKLYVPIILLLMSTMVFAQQPQEILDKAREAVGGEKALEEIETLEYKIGRYQTDEELLGESSITVIKPDKVIMVSEIDNVQMAMGQDGEVFWIQEGEEITEMGKIESDVWALTSHAYALGFVDQLKDSVFELEYAGERVWNGQESHAISLTHPLYEDVRGTAYFSKESNLPLGFDMNYKKLHHIYFKDWKEKGTIKYASTITYVIDGETVDNVKIMELSINEMSDDKNSAEK